MLRGVKAFIARQQFTPGLIGPFVNPFFLARHGLHTEIRRVAPKIQGLLLDVGCGRRPYRELFGGCRYIGLEIQAPQQTVLKKADVLYDGLHFPFADQQFDAIICNQVIEHVFEPAPFLDSIHRLLKPGGKLLITAPFVWDEHEQPRDYARYTSFGLAYLLRKHGFEVQKLVKINPGPAALCQLVNAYLYKMLWTKKPILNLITCTFLMAPFSVLGASLQLFLPKGQDLYLDQLVLAARTAQ